MNSELYNVVTCLYYLHVIKKSRVFHSCVFHSRGFSARVFSVPITLTGKNLMGTPPLGSNSIISICCVCARNKSYNKLYNVVTCQDVVDLS